MNGLKHQWLMFVTTGLRACGLVRTGQQGHQSLPGGSLLICLIGLAGCHSTPTVEHEPLVARFYLEVSRGETGGQIRLPNSGVVISVQEKPVITEYDLRNAEVAQVELGRCLMLELTPEAARDLHRLTAIQLGQRLVLFLNGAPVGARRIDQTIADGVILVFLETPESDLTNQVARLKRTSADIRMATAKK